MEQPWERFHLERRVHEQACVPLGRGVPVHANEQSRGRLGLQETSRRETALVDARSDPAVAAILQQFPGARITNIRIPDAQAAETDLPDAPAEPMPEDDSQDD